MRIDLLFLISLLCRVRYDRPTVGYGVRRASENRRIVGLVPARNQSRKTMKKRNLFITEDTVQILSVNAVQTTYKFYVQSNMHIHAPRRAVILYGATVFEVAWL